MQAGWVVAAGEGRDQPRTVVVPPRLHLAAKA